MEAAKRAAAKAVSTVASKVANVFGFGAKVEDYPYRMLLIGETGAGKTSFLNLLCNCGMIKMLHREFNLELLQDFHDIKLEHASSHKMESKTSGAKLYSAVLGEMKIGIIDTPGFGDSRGIEQDERNVKSIIDVLREEEYVNCVCLVINGRESRMHATLQYVLSEITAVLPKKIIGNVIVVFTNTANPLNLNFDLQQLRPFFGQTVVDDHTFYIENPYCTLEKAKMKFGQLPKGVIAKGLKKSFEETAEVLDEMSEAIKDFKKVYTHDFISLYEKKQKIEESIVTMLTEIDNQNRIEKAIADAQEEAEAALKKKSLNKNFTVVQTYPTTEVVDTNHHNTLCNAENCTSNCHEHCSLARSLNRETFRSCACMNGGTYCTECGHHYTHHYHMEKRYEKKLRVKHFVDEDMRRRFDEAKTMEDRARIFKETHEFDRKKSVKIRKDLGNKLLELLEEYQKLGMARNYAKVLQNQVEVIKRRLKGAVGPQSHDLQKTQEKLEQKLQVVSTTLQEPFSSNDTSWACNILELDESHKPITEDMVTQAFRRLSRTEHPDKGGDDSYFQRLERAKQILLQKEGDRERHVRYLT